MLTKKQTSDHRDIKCDNAHESKPIASQNLLNLTKNNFSRGLFNGNIHKTWDNVKHKAINTSSSEEKDYIHTMEILPEQLHCLSLDECCYGDHLDRDLAKKNACCVLSKQHCMESPLAGSFDNSISQAKQYSSLKPSDFLQKLNPFENHSCCLHNNGSNLFNDPNDIEDIINSLNSRSNELNNQFTEQSIRKKEFQTDRFGQPYFQTMSTFPSHNSKDDHMKNVLHVPKENCGACGEEIVGKVLMALGKMWHLEHFTCCQCGIQLGTDIFYEESGKAFCEYDYINLFSPRCAACNEPVVERCVTALNKTWHPHHFLCCYCKQQFTEGGYHEVDGLVYCSQDFYYLFAPKCFGCGEAIVKSYITALNQQWHASCFVCYECQEPFKSGSFYGHYGFPFCEQHLNILKRGLCAYCNQMIIGPSVTAMGKKYHPGHFACTFCSQIINQGTFKEHENKPYCHLCSERLFG